MTWSIAAAFVVHNDIRSHTKACSTTGKGSLINLSMEQKINTKISTEAKIVGVEDAMIFLIWSKLYFKWLVKDYPDEESKIKLLGKINIVQQDNTGAIQLEQHSKTSSTKKTSNISIRYF